MWRFGDEAFTPCPQKCALQGRTQQALRQQRTHVATEQAFDRDAHLQGRTQQLAALRQQRTPHVATEQGMQRAHAPRSYQSILQ